MLFVLMVASLASAVLSSWISRNEEDGRFD